MTNGERYKIFKEWFDSIGFPEMHSSYKDAMWQGFEAGYCKAPKVNDAAPELLEVLQKILSSAYEIEHDFYGLPGGEDFDISQVIKDAKSAIIKALGE